MPIRVSCSACGSVINAPDKAAGKTGRCPKCGQVVRIPAPGSKPLPPAPSLPPKPSEPTPTVASPAPTPAPPTEAYDVEVEQDDEFDVEVEAAAAAFDVEVEAEDDNEVKVDAPKRPPQPLKPAPPTIADVPLPATEPTIATANPFAAFGPPPDSPAAKLSFGGEDEPAAVRESAASEFSPKWSIVRAGLNQLKLAAFISILAVIVSMVAQSLATFRANFDVLSVVLLSLGMLIGLVSLVFVLLGLNKCMSAPMPKDGGPGPQLAQLAFYAALAAVLLAVCGVGILAALALPFLIGFFLRAVGQSLSSPATTSAATRYLVAVGLGLPLGVLLVLVPLVFSLMQSPKSSASSLPVITLAANACSGFVQIAVLLFAALAYSTTASEIQRRFHPRKSG